MSQHSPAAPRSGPLISLGRIEGLDGLRGVALLMVIIAHLFLLNLGWMGMQSFFVLSGFLITRILIKDKHAAPDFRGFLGLFYLRRVLRVFPLYYSYLLVIMLGAWLAGELAPMREHLPWAFSYTYNYFHTVADYQHSYFFSHLWSMSVEEQFYLIWPLVIWLTPSRHLNTLLTAVVLAGPAVRYGIHLSWPPGLGFDLNPRIPLAAYLLTPSHLDAFAAGALVNLVRWRPRYVHVLVALALLLALGMAVNGPGLGPAYPGGPVLSLGWPLMMPRGLQYVWGYSLVNLFWVLTILAIVNPANPGAPFQWRLFDWLGKRSYSSYLVHYPILLAMFPLWGWCQELTGGRLSGTLLLMTVYLPLTFAVADFTYRYIELPTLQLKERFSTRPNR